MPFIFQKNPLNTVEGVALALEMLAVEVGDRRLKCSVIDGGPDKLRYVAGALRRAEPGSPLEAYRLVRLLSGSEAPLLALQRSLRRLCLARDGREGAIGSLGGL